MYKIKQYMKLKREHFDDMVNGTKEYEFRKASKGYVSGLTGFLDIEAMEKDKMKYDFEHTYWSKDGTTIGKEQKLNLIQKYLMGTADLLLVLANPGINKYTYSKITGFKDEYEMCIAEPLWDMFQFEGIYPMTDVPIDPSSAIFVLKNYIDTKTDFLAFKISNVKEHDYGN